MNNQKSEFQVKPFPDFSWSLSRHALLSECPRAYYYHYYASHNGWLKDAPEQTRKVYVLKNITNIYLLLGSLIHERAKDVINSIVNKTPPPALEILTKITRDELRQAVRESRDKDAFYRTPKYRSMLHEYYYGEGITEEMGEKIIERMEACLKNLLECELLKELPNVDTSCIKAVDKLDSINLNGINVYCAPDLVLLNPRVCQIVDWKTGKDLEENEEDEAWQVKVYAKYAKEKFKLNETLEIKADLVYLENGTMDERVITTKDIEDVESFINDSIENMQGYLEDKDSNFAKGTGYFPVTNDEKACSRCNFIEVCNDKK